MSKKPCYRCLKQHEPKDCPFKNAVAEYFVYKMTCHIKVACLLRKASAPHKKNCKAVKVKTLQEQSLNYTKDIANDLSFVKPIAINGKINQP